LYKGRLLKCTDLYAILNTTDNSRFKIKTFRTCVCYFTQLTNMKKYLAILGIICLVYACSGNSSENKEKQANIDTVKPYDAKKGVGHFTHVDLNPLLDQKLADSGMAMYGLKCASCHKLTDEKMVGPGWKGVTKRREPEWIMNFVTNTKEMLNKDTTAQAMLEVCLVEMPNQNLSDLDARKMLEFMRENDGVK
jgi:cytochrome c551/c552